MQTWQVLDKNDIFFWSHLEPVFYVQNIFMFVCCLFCSVFFSAVIVWVILESTLIVGI